MLKKISTDKGLTIVFDDSLGDNINGQYENGTITINPNSTRTGEFIAIHELTHAIGTNQMRKIIDTYRQSNADFNKAVQNLIENYGSSELTEEAMADVSGQLFGNQEFINNLADTNPSLFKRIYQEIKYLYHQFTGYKNQNQFIEDLQYKWEQAYRNKNKLNTNQKYSIGGETAINRLVDSKYKSNALNALEKAKQMEQEGKTNEEIWKQTKWFKDKNGKWKFEFTDELISLKNMPKPNQEYKLSDIIKHPYLFHLYPELKDYKITFKDIKNAKGSYSRINQEIKINNDYIKNNDTLNMKGTILHEIQHAIQQIEGFEHGSSARFSKLAYYNKLGEIEANEVKQRYLKNITKENRTKITPEYVKENPTHSGLNNYLKTRSKVDKVKDKVYSIVNRGGLNAKESEKENKEISEQDRALVDGGRLLNKELDNSSFSLDKNAKRYDDLTETSYIEYFVKDNGDVRINLMDSNNNLVNQLDLYNQREAIMQLGEELGKRIYQTSSRDNQIYRIGNDINNTGSETDYFMTHRPSETGAFASDISDNGNLMPQDIYEHPEWYFKMDKAHRESYDILKEIRGNPNAEITIYRATPGTKINKGDWITLSKTYAEEHNNSQFDGKANILEKTVKAKDVQYAGDDICEFGYYPDMPQFSKNNTTWKEYLESNFKSKGTTTKFADIVRNGKNKNIEITTPEAKQVIREIKKSIEPVKKDMAELTKQIDEMRTALNLPKRKVMNPTEISKLTKQDANTTPTVSKIKVSTGNGESSFANNIRNKTNMLTEESKQKILSEADTQYYQKVTNKESMSKALDRLDTGGRSETLSWFQKDSVNADSTDVAEGWILMKQYQDSGNYDGMVEVAKKMREIGTKAGQTVQAFNIMERMTPEGMVKYAQSELTEAYNKMVKNKTKQWIETNREKFDLQPNEVQFILDTMKEVSTMEEGYDKKVKLAEIQKIMTDKLPADKGKAIKSWMRISMLFNPKTQVRNVVGNAIIAPVNYIGDVFASKADKIISKKTGVRTTGTMNVKAILQGMKDGAYQATNDYKLGINTKDMEGNRFEMTEGKSFNDKTIIGKSLNKVDNLLNYVMDAGDRVFSQSSFENSLQNQMLLNNTTEITQEMIDIARSESLQRTWNDNNNYTRFVLNVRKGLNAINFNGYGLGDILIPFAKTPANLTKAIVDYSPVGMINAITEGKSLSRSLSNGQYNAQLQHDFVQRLGKATAGTMLYILGYALAKSGVTSGESDDDKDTANFLKNTLGVNSYSIKIGGKSFTYDWAQPIAAPISIMANIVNTNKNKEQALLESVVSSLDTAGSILLEQSFLQSLNDVLSSKDGIVSGLINETLELPSRAIPTFMKQIADLTDKTQRTSYEYGKPIQSAINSAKSKIPGLNQTLAPSVDTMGREIQRYGGKSNIFNVFLNPANVSTENISKSAEEIYRLYQQTGDKTIMPRVSPNYINQKGEKVILNSRQRAEYQKISGRIIEDSIQELLNNADYQKLSDAEKSDVVNKLVDYSYNKARKDVLNIDMAPKYNSISKYVDKGGQASYYYLHKKEIDYSLKYPGKYNYMKQVSGYDSFNKYKTEIDKIRKQYKNSTSAKRKTETIKYVNSLKLNIPQKAMLIRNWYSSYDGYNKQIYDYVNNSDLTTAEKIGVYKQLGFKVKGGRVYW